MSWDHPTTICPRFPVTAFPACYDSRKTGVRLEMLMKPTPLFEASEAESQRLIAMRYRNFLMSSYWKNVRAKVLALHPHCAICRSQEKVHVHHNTYEHHGYEHIYWQADLVVLCYECHMLYHARLCCQPPDRLTPTPIDSGLPQIKRITVEPEQHVSSFIIRTKAIAVLPSVQEPMAGYCCDRLITAHTDQMVAPGEHYPVSDECEEALETLEKMLTELGYTKSEIAEAPRECHAKHHGKETDSEPERRSE